MTCSDRWRSICLRGPKVRGSTCLGAHTASTAALIAAATRVCQGTRGARHRRSLLRLPPWWCPKRRGSAAAPVEEARLQRTVGPAFDWPWCQPAAPAFNFDGVLRTGERMQGAQQI